ncbi:hypothetical protein K443DRAFT_10861 [Laccaria amethystina LaAM-08-1]|uniref:Uncharacterized protein n=1 Tax=Laccaria amethystina LaAM-08-1 TaxID=1095629 RepID=A0A0C9WUU4_9AGAR|nr:hypothetical protein K443DRAFT_10861 [Laccaria amethystina LaAM-08-1]
MVHTYPPNVNYLVASTKLGPGFQGEKAHHIKPVITATGINPDVLGIQVLYYNTLLDHSGKPGKSFLTEGNHNIPSINLENLIHHDDLVGLEQGRLEQQQTIDWNEITTCSGTIDFQGIATPPVP